MPLPLQSRILEALRKRFGIQGTVTGQLLDDVMPVCSLFDVPADLLHNEGVHLAYAATTSPAAAGSFSNIVLSGTAVDLIITVVAIWSPIQVEVAIQQARSGGVATRARALDFRDVTVPPVQLEVFADIAPGAPNHVFLAPGRNVLREVIKTDPLLGAGFSGIVANTALTLGFEVTYRNAASPDELTA